MPRPSTAGAGYRFLRAGEPLLVTDEYWAFDDGWKRLNCVSHGAMVASLDAIGQPYQEGWYRRKLPPFDGVSQAELDEVSRQVNEAIQRAEPAGNATASPGRSFSKDLAWFLAPLSNWMEKRKARKAERLERRNAEARRLANERTAQIQAQALAAQRRAGEPVTVVVAAHDDVRDAVNLRRQRALSEDVLVPVETYLQVLNFARSCPLEEVLLSRRRDVRDVRRLADTREIRAHVRAAVAHPVRDGASREDFAYIAQTACLDDVGVLELEPDPVGLE